MAPRTVSRNNLIAGIFVIGGVVLAVVMSIVISDAQERLITTRPYVVRFAISDGTSGLKEGSAVTLAGQPVGRVTKVEFHRPDASSPPDGVDVHISIDASLQLYEDAWAFLERPLLGNLSSINIASIGTGTEVANPQGGDPRLAPGEVLPGIMAPPAFLAQAGYGPEQARQFKLMLSQASEAVERINRITAKIEAQVDPTISGIRSSIDDVNAVTSEVRGKVPAWTDRIDTVMQQAESASGKLDPIADDISAAVQDLRAAIQENRPALDRIVASIDEAAARVNTESVALLNEALTNVRTGSEQYVEAGQTFNTVLQEQLPNIRRIIANFRLAADQIKLAGIEVRRNPWRLLYQPTTKELESELFYDAARTYAQAVSDLRAASDSLQSISAGPAPGGIDQEQVRALNTALQDAFERYREAEQKLLNQMIEKQN